MALLACIAFAIEPYGRLGRPAVEVLGEWADAAAGNGAFDRDAYLTWVKYPRRGPPPAPRPLGRRGPATVSSPPQALGPVGVVCERACVSLRPCLCITKPVLGVRCSGLARPCAPALPCLAVFLGAGELPRRLVFSCMCAGMVPVAPAVGAVLVCACGPGGRRCGLMCVWYLR